ncbi:hypothetical protein AO263_03155 [Pseudomonas sp. NZIPFR-PS5]|nr:hypothetical protein AO263_03155 [Pseudomonas sp. NZIPFR-PS5]
MLIRLTKMLINARVNLIATWRWLGERLNRRLIIVCLNVCRAVLIAYFLLFFFRYYSFGWLI